LFRSNGFEQALVLENRQRLANGRAADLQRLADPLLDQPFAWRQHAAKDGVLDRFIRHLPRAETGSILREAGLDRRIRIGHWPAVLPIYTSTGATHRPRTSTTPFGLQRDHGGGHVAAGMRLHASY